MSIVYFNSGAIGEFLMTLYFSDIVRRSAQTNGKPAPRVVVPVRRNAPLLTELAREYPQVEVVSIAAAEVLTGFRRLIRLPRPAIVLTQQTFSALPFKLKLFALLVARILRSPLYGFADESRANRYVYDRTWAFDTGALFPQEMQRLAERLGFPGSYESPRLAYPAQKSPIAEPYVIFHIASFTPARTLPPGRWRALLHTARERFPDHTFVLTGSASDRALIATVTAGMNNVMNAAGRFNVPELIGAIDHASAYVGVDTGITHLAAFRGRPMIVLGTRSTPSWWATYNPATVWLTDPSRCSCTGDKHGDCYEVAEGAKRFRCLLDITDNSVLDALARLI